VGIKILLTGTSGFLGSHIAKHLVSFDFELIALKRKDSDLSRCESFKKNITWINIDSNGVWKEKVIKLKPKYIIHSAWIGVDSVGRDDIIKQSKNISFLSDLLDISKSTNLTRFISLGSQAEYGVLNTKVSEDSEINPINLYGATKVASQQILKTFCELNKIDWVWLRLFSFIGENQDRNWLIPQLISKIKNKETLDMTMGHQKYSFIYVNDFTSIILKILNSNIESGIYNISSEEPHSIRELSNLISIKLEVSQKINWGVLPYRLNQSMHIEGEMNKLKKQIGDFKFVTLSHSLDRVISANKKNI
jgi:nucleoside-diphosphate-sugar epimerase